MLRWLGLVAHDVWNMLRSCVKQNPLFETCWLEQVGFVVWNMFGPLFRIRCVVGWSMLRHWLEHILLLIKTCCVGFLKHVSTYDDVLKRHTRLLFPVHARCCVGEHPRLVHLLFSLLPCLPHLSCWGADGRDG